MSHLQIALIVLAVVVIAGVYLFNRWQEARYRKRAESAFKQRHEDVLMNDASPAPAPAARVRDRIEPQMQGLVSEGEESATIAQQPQEMEKAHIAAETRPDRRAQPRDASEPKASFVERAASTLMSGKPPSEPPEKIEPPSISVPAPSAPPPGADRLDYQVDLVSAVPIPHNVLEKALKQLSDLANRVRLWGAYEGHWNPVDLRAAAKYSRVRATIQLVNRAGMVSKEDLVVFKRAFERCATEFDGTLESAEIEPFLEVAQTLDKFCESCDVLLSLSVIAQKSGPFAGTKVRAWAESAGFQLRANGVFQMNDENGATALSMESHENPGFLPERIRTLTTNGITLLLDVPRVTNGLHAFDRLVALARQLAGTMGGTLVDDNRSPVTESGLDHIRQQLKKIYEEMDAHGVPAGSALALRLFQ